MRAIVLLLLCSVLGWTSAAVAETKGDKKAQKTASNASLDRYFQALDLNGDGYVSLAEAAGDPVIVQRFDKGDRNRDGKLSEKEFANLSKVKVRVAKSKKGKGAEPDEPSAAVGGSAPDRLTRSERQRQRQLKSAAESGG
jgi:hypothetical protein